MASRLFAALRRVDDVLLHEMVHLELAPAGQDTNHSTPAWCRRVVDLSPRVLGHAIVAAPVLPRRVDGDVRRLPQDGHLNRHTIATWPMSLRPPEFYGGGPGIAVDPGDDLPPPEKMASGLPAHDP